MSGNWRTWVVVGLGIAVVSAAIYFPILRRRVKTAAKIAEPSEEQARRELTQAITQNASDPVVKVKMFWTSSEDESALAPVTIQLALSKDAALRAKQVINTLLAGPVDSDLRTLPPDAALLAFTCCRMEPPLLIFPRRWPLPRLLEFKANNWPWIRSPEHSKPTCRR